MTYVRSFSHLERELMHHYRRQMNHAESEEDIRKFFTQTTRKLLERVIDDGSTVEDSDVVLKPDASPYYEISGRLHRNGAFQDLCRHSDLNAVLKRFAEPAAKHFQHLKRHPEKTESKIRHFS